MAKYKKWGDLFSPNIEPVQETNRVAKSGECHNCFHGGFELELKNHDIIRVCKNCKSKYNVDKGEIVNEL